MIKRFVTQKAAEGDCGAACIAMVLDVPYERVEQSVPPDIIPNGLLHTEVIHTIMKISGEVWGLYDYSISQIQIKDLSFPDEPIILSVTKPEAGGAAHYVAADGFLFYDPLEAEPVTLDEAKAENQSKWDVRAIFRPSPFVPK